jgi:acyl-CoA thioesterase I
MPNAMRICFIGDSFVSGAYDEECLGWVGRICATARFRRHDVSAYNLGVRGETSAQIARRWRAEAEPRQSLQHDGRLVFEFGVNDAREVNGKVQMQTGQSLAVAREILHPARAWKPTLMLGPPPGADAARNARVQAMSEGLADLCRELVIPYFDSYAALLASPTWIASVKGVDGTHPSAAGYAEWAGAIDAWPAWRAWLP